MRDNVNLPFYATRLRSAYCAASSWRARNELVAANLACFLRARANTPTRFRRPYWFAGVGALADGPGVGLGVGLGPARSIRLKPASYPASEL
jgi:hypothetical protein